MHPSARRFAPLLLTTLALLPARAHAEYPAPAPYIGVHGGASVQLRPWDLGSYTPEGDTNVALGASGLGGLRVGVQILPRFGAELGASMIPITAKDGVGSLVTSFDLDAFYQFTDGDWTPYASLGVGGYHPLGGDITADFDPHGQVGVGVRGLFLPWMALRVEARDVISDGLDALGSNNLELRIGLDVFPTATKAKDTDDDGIADEDDACIDVPGVASANGCPDKDGDSVTDNTDECPTTAGEVRLNGCVDTDSDGLIDTEDSCPSEKGPEEFKGCPDTDDDGLPDWNDTCPEEAGTAANRGCPDTDSDGIVDSRDACPNEPGPQWTKGCPDRDGDAVVDTEDECPDVRGLRDYKGCVPAAVQKYTGAIKGINFETNSATILANSYKILDQANEVLQSFPELRLQIDGHTDDVGADDANMTLSAARARSVREYLIAKGIDESRLLSKGYGETAPIADNTTNTGRAANRRIEFSIADR
jgi:outer membrane protein OmpA-like peptidoglycan-associated protein